MKMNENEPFFFARLLYTWNWPKKAIFFGSEPLEGIPGVGAPGFYTIFPLFEYPDCQKAGFLAKTRLFEKRDSRKA